MISTVKSSKKKFFTLMVIDDDPIFMTLITQLVRLHGDNLKCQTFTNPTQALEQIDDIKPEVLFIDINMPVLSGWDVIEHLVDTGYSHTDIYVVSSSVDRNDQSKALSYSIVKGFISKPITVSKFRDLINQL